MSDREAPLQSRQSANALVIPVDNLLVRWGRRLGTDAVTNVRVMHSHDDPLGPEINGSDSGGCRELGWLMDPLGTPLGIFATLLVEGFASREDMQAALHQFRNVEGQEIWATFLLLLSHDSNISRILDQEEIEGKSGYPTHKH
jgi:hypothetical protein